MNLKSNVAVTIALVCIVPFSIYGQDKSLEKVKLKLQYMAYACGDCYPEYRVVKIIEPKNDKTANWLKGKDVNVDFSDKDEDRIESMRGNCAICFYYEVEGALVRKDSAKLVLVPMNYKMYEKSKGCCDKMTKALEEGRKKSSN